MEIDKQQTLERFRERLSEEVSGGLELIESFERAGLTLSRIEPNQGEKHTREDRRPTRWLLFWELPEPLRESFDFAPELLLVLVPWLEGQARDVSAAEEAIRRDHRLDRGVVLFISNDVKAAQRLAQAAQHTGRLYIFLSLAEVGGITDPQRWMRDLFLERIGSADLFASGNPVLGWDFVGRQQEIRAIRGRLLSGRPVGLYGLRKSGKTSVLMALKEQLLIDSTSEGSEVTAIPIYLDLLTLSFAEQKRSGFMRLLGRHMCEALERFGIPLSRMGLPESFCEPQYLRRMVDSDLERLVPDALEALIDWAALQPSRPAILLLIDEYERLLGASRFPVEDGLDVFDYLRGLVQRHPKTFNLLIAGLDREKASVSRYGRRQNPLFNFVIDYPLAGLTREEMGELIRKVGRRLALNFDAEAIEVIWRETGGHPYLAREYGRVIDQAVPARERAPKVVSRALALEHLEAFRLGVSLTMQEIYDAVVTIDGSAIGALVDALHFPEATDEILRDMKPETLHALRRYGILSEPGSPEFFRIGCFGAWLLQNQPTNMDSAANG